MRLTTHSVYLSGCPLMSSGGVLCNISGRDFSIPGAGFGAPVSRVDVGAGSDLSASSICAVVPCVWAARVWRCRICAVVNGARIDCRCGVFLRLQVGGQHSMT